ncbi:MAG: DinB family protein [Ferruginibacter sp.]|nr:DinB family protein [Ferruginibacter sp.]
MLKQGLISEFQHEVENTRKLLKAVPDAALNWKPTEKNWTTAELASHIAGIYNWFYPVIHQNELVLDNHKYDRGDISKMENILAKFEENVASAREALDDFDESKAMDKWRLVLKGNELIPPMPKVAVIRGVLCNHLYHHRGELVVYLRLTGNKVPGLYGPSADEM